MGVVITAPEMKKKMDSINIKDQTRGAFRYGIHSVLSLPILMLLGKSPYIKKPVLTLDPMEALDKDAQALRGDMDTVGRDLWEVLERYADTH